MNTPRKSPPEKWELRQPYSLIWVLVLLAAAVLLSFSARRNSLDTGLLETLRGAGQMLGVVSSSEVAEGWTRFIGSAFPLVLSEKRATARIPDFDPDRLPPLAYLVREPIRDFDSERGQWRTAGEQDVLVQPGGYLFHVIGKMLETLEIALWGTLLAVVLAVPLAFLGATGLSPHRWCVVAARGLCSFNRAIPELISALLFVLMYGFGAVAGVLALGIHTSGFLGKFFADDIENAEKGPQESLEALGANRVKILRYAVLPEVMPQYLAYMQYILERNVRTAAVLGIVGAGGIGMELKGRWDLYDFGHVSTILLVIFITVFLLENITHRLRFRLIG